MSDSNVSVAMKAVADAFNAAMTVAAKSIQRLAESLDRSIKESEWRLAERFAKQQGSLVNTSEWLDGGNGDVMWVVTLANRRKLVGMGPARLEALADAEQALSVLDEAVKRG